MHIVEGQTSIFRFLFTTEPRLLRLSFFIAADPEGPGCCALLLALVSILLIIATLPFSLCMCIKVSALVKKVGERKLVLGHLSIVSGKPNCLTRCRCHGS